MLNVYTGENRLLPPALIEKIGRALAEEDCAQYIVVPKQLTLLTERMLIAGLKLRGSFRLRVLSPARLCGLIFDETGVPSNVRIDERGRVMLLRALIRENADALTVYKNAERRRGFAEKCAKQLGTFVQGGVSGDQLRECAEVSAGLTRMKLNDLALLLDCYAEKTAAQYQDGESELILAAQRVEAAGFVPNSHFWFFGFDLMPPTLIHFMNQFARNSRAELFFALKNDEHAPDYDCYTPMDRALERIAASCALIGAEHQRIALADSAPDGEIRRLERELYAYPVQPWTQPTEKIHLTLAKDPREECMAAAARCRKLAMSGLRYGEIQLLCCDLESYRPLLIDAFQTYEVPLFLSDSRPVSRMATAQCLLGALKLLEKNFRSEDVFALMRTGYMDVDRDEADRLANYAVRRGVDGSRWLRPLNRGDAAEIEELEPVRKRLMAPLINLRENLRAADTLKAQLTVLFGFLEEISAYDKSLKLQRELSGQGLKEAAGELAQAWNRIIGALDQMAALMGEKKMSLRELSQTLNEALDAAALKALPQSGDAVYAQPVGRMLMQNAKALLVLGMSDRSAAGEDGLLTAAQKKAVSQKTKAYLGPDESDSARLRRFYLKSALGMAQDAVFFSCALSNTDGSAARPDMAVGLIRELFPQMKEDGGVNGLGEALACAPKAAVVMAGNALSAVRDGANPKQEQLRAAAALKQTADRLPKAYDQLRRMGELLSGRGTDQINPASARALYGKIQAISVTRLEKFAGCPFAHFVNYGLKPQRVEPFELDRRDEGNFLHGAVYAFLKQSGNGLNTMSGDEAERRMASIADEMLSSMRIGTPMEDSAAVRAEGRALRAAACRCARVLAEHMRGSKFYTDQLERDFGREDGSQRLRAGDTALEGRIDRVDSYPEGNSLRIIDFKLGGKPLNLAGAYHGLQLQLPVYLGAAMKQTGSRSAGVYYFALDEGIADTQSTDPDEVEKLRGNDFRMTGLLPEDPELLNAMSDTPERVFNGQFTKEKKPYASVPCADDRNFERLIRHTLKMAQQQIDAIRSGEAKPSPAQFANRTPCTYCDYRSACLFDEKMDSSCVRRYKNIKWNEVFDRIAVEDE